MILFEVSFEEVSHHLTCFYVFVWPRRHPDFETHSSLSVALSATSADVWLYSATHKHFVVTAVHWKVLVAWWKPFHCAATMQRDNSTLNHAGDRCSGETCICSPFWIIDTVWFHLFKGWISAQRWCKLQLSHPHVTSEAADSAQQVWGGVKQATKEREGSNDVDVSNIFCYALGSSHC